MIYAAQLRAGRALLAWRQEDLAKKAKVGLATVQRIEQSAGLAVGHASTIWKLQTALQDAGVRFISGEEIGVCRPVEAKRAPSRPNASRNR